MDYYLYIQKEDLLKFGSHLAEQGDSHLPVLLLKCLPGGQDTS